MDDERRPSRMICPACGQAIQPTDSIGGTSYRTLHLDCYVTETEDATTALALPAPRGTETAFRL